VFGRCVYACGWVNGSLGGGVKVAASDPSVYTRFPHTHSIHPHTHTTTTPRLPSRLQLLNLLLVGRAVSNVFDGDKELGDSGAFALCIGFCACPVTHIHTYIHIHTHVYTHRRIIQRSGCAMPLIPPSPNRHIDTSTHTIPSVQTGLKLRGISSRPTIGYLTHLETLRYVQASEVDPTEPYYSMGGCVCRIG
jgi:hypothetical protein